MRGELKIPGYSAYLHPANDNRLIGVGPGRTDRGMQGIQCVPVDVGNLADPIGLAKYTLRGTYSEAEFDPHAFLYRPATRTARGATAEPVRLRRTGRAGGGPGSSGSGIAAPDRYAARRALLLV